MLREEVREMLQSSLGRELLTDKKACVQWEKEKGMGKDFTEKIRSCDSFVTMKY